MDWIIFFFVVALVIWLNIKQDKKERRQNSATKNIRAEPKKEITTVATKPSKLISGRSYFSYGPSNSKLQHLRRPMGEWICGCNGIPLTLLPEYSIDYEAYKRCSARLRRKQSGVYTDDQGQVRAWKPGSTTRAWTTKRVLARRS